VFHEGAQRTSHRVELRERGPNPKKDFLFEILAIERSLTKQTNHGRRSNVRGASRQRRRFQEDF
jgi:hypothetical protein